jgi:HlyD family secretion protein
VAARQAERAAAQAQVAQRESELDAAKRRLARSETLAKEGASSMQELDDDRARARNAQAAVDAAKAQMAAADAAVRATEASRVGSEASVKAAAATIERINVDLADNELKAPRDGRVQFRLAQPGEVLGAGGRVLNMVDLSDVYMTFFLPESVAGRLAMGAEVRIVLDVAQQFVIPARVSFVASTAQFTPKTVETASERQKLMFRVRARIDEALLKSRLEQVKTGLPGVAWIRLDDQQPWPAQLSQLVQVK